MSGIVNRMSPASRKLALVSPQVNSEDLVGASEIAGRLGMRSVQAVHNWRSRHADFPAPLAELEMGLVWHWPDIEAWARATGRLS